MSTAPNRLRPSLLARSRERFIAYSDLESSPGFSRAGWIVTAAVIGLLLLPTLFHPLDLDQSLFDLHGRMILEGSVYYRDMIDIKPPLISFIYAAANFLFNAGDLSIRLLDYILQCVTCWLIIVLVRRGSRSDMMAAAAAICYAILYAGQHYGALAQTESYMGLLGLGMTWLALYRRTPLGFIAIGVMGALLWLLKFSFAGMLAAIMIAELVVSWSSLRNLIGHWLLMLTGAGSIVALFFVYLSATGAYHDFLLVSGFARGYALGYLSMPKKIFLKFVELTPLELLGVFSILLMLGILAGIALSLRQPPPRERGVHHPSKLLRICTLVFLFLIGTIMAEGKYFTYHFGRLFAFGAILGSAGLLFTANRVMRRIQLRRYTLAFTAMILVGTLLFSPLMNYGRKGLMPVIQQLRHGGAIEGLSLYEYSASEPRLIGEYIAKLRKPGDELFAAAGIGGAIYYHTGFMPRTKINHFAYVTATYAAQEWKDSVRAYLLREPPRFIISDFTNSAPSMLGNDMSSDDGLYSLPGVDSLLRTSYTPTMRTGHLQLYERKY